MSDNQKLVQLVQKIGEVRVLVVGDAMLDHYVIGSVNRISPEAPVPILRVREEFDRVGGAANVAANVVSLSGHAELACLTGKDDADSDRLIEKCVELGFSPLVSGVLERTTRKTRMMAGQQQMLRVDWEQDVNSHHDYLTPEFRASLNNKFNQANAILLSDYAKGMVNAELMELLLGTGIPVIVDPRPIHVDLYKGVHLITPNRKEACELLGISTDTNITGEELGKRICEKLSCNTLVTLGEDGMCLVTLDGQTESIATCAEEVYDVTGAGDTVAATVSLGIGAGASLSEAAHLANAAAGIVVKHIGTVSVSPRELQDAVVNL